MVRLRLKELLAERGKTSYWLAKEAGVRYATIWTMINGNVARLHLDALDRICMALECQPGDLLVQVQSRAKKAAQTRKRGN
jgi:putative transcriptional regulator